MSASALSGGSIPVDGGAAIISRGVCWNTSINPTIADSKTNDGTGVGSYISNINGLTPGTTYHIRAYVTNSGGTAYGADVPFTTVVVLPTVTTAEVSEIASANAISGGNVLTDGGAPVTARGVCWSKSANPTTSDSKTVDGSGTGSYVSSLTKLSKNTTYYIRAYATSVVGTAYGSIKIFTTLN